MIFGFSKNMGLIEGGGGINLFFTSQCYFFGGIVAVIRGGLSVGRLPDSSKGDLKDYSCLSVDFDIITTQKFPNKSLFLIACKIRPMYEEDFWSSKIFFILIFIFSSKPIFDPNFHYRGVKEPNFIRFGLFSITIWQLLREKQIRFYCSGVVSKPLQYQFDYQSVQHPRHWYSGHDWTTDISFGKNGRLLTVNCTLLFLVFRGGGSSKNFCRYFLVLPNWLFECSQNRDIDQKL